jgi:membrane protein DedA with SNARE-associated domain
VTGFLERLEAWLAAGEDWAVPVVFAITFVESLPGVSLLVPSTALLLATGALIGAGTLEPGPVLAAAIAGAIVGDAVGFWLSRAYGPRIVRRWLPRSQRRPYARALLLFRRWGWAAVFFGRFLGPVRAVAPLMAGVARMPEWRFQAANVASALLWAPLMLLPGYAAALGLEWLRVAEDPLLAGGLLVVLAGGGWLAWRRIRRPRATSRRVAGPARTRG